MQRIIFAPSSERDYPIDIVREDQDTGERVVIDSSCDIDVAFADYPQAVLEFVPCQFCFRPVSIRENREREYGTCQKCAAAVMEVPAMEYMDAIFLYAADIEYAEKSVPEYIKRGLTLHVFADGFDQHFPVAEIKAAVDLFKSLQEQGYPNIRLYGEYENAFGQPCWEDAILSVGNYPA